MNASLAARVEYFWNGLHIADPGLTREAFDTLIGDLPFPEFLSLVPQPLDRDASEGESFDLLDTFGGDPMVHERISIDPSIMFGKPVITGTRIPVDLLLKKIGSGLPESEILAQHPHLSREDLLAAVAYAADCVPGPLPMIPGGTT
ncbi:MAG: hypothetical protein JWN86_2983 [Planctomycetota bacterium]|nr:hypothetical protein [Planctomycetota bacterium]